MADEDNEVEQTHSGASETYPQQCSALRKNGYVMIKNRPCKIVEMSTSKTGKHGHAKVHMVAIDVFTGKKLEDICPSTHNMNVPNVNRQDYLVMDIADDGFVHMMDDNGDLKNDLKLPDNDIGKDLAKRYENGEALQVSVLKACGEELIVAVKTDTGNK